MAVRRSPGHRSWFFYGVDGGTSLFPVAGWPACTQFVLSTATNIHGHPPVDLSICAGQRVLLAKVSDTHRCWRIPAWSRKGGGLSHAPSAQSSP
jgi:hypothetical protein